MLIVKDLEDQYHYEIRVVEKNISKFADFIDFLIKLTETIELSRNLNIGSSN